MDTQPVVITQDDYASHVPVLTALLDAADIRRAVEHGCGVYSTPILASRCSGFSVDDVEAWIDAAARELPKEREWVFCLGDELFSGDFKGVDLAFIDGKEGARLESAQNALNAGVRFVVLHDAERPGTYKWHRLRVPTAYHRYDFEAQFGRRKVTRIYALEPVDISPENHVRL